MERIQMTDNWQPKSDKWQKAGQNPTWEFQKEGVGATFFGKFISMQENVGINNSCLYDFMRYEDEDLTKKIGVQSVWGSTILDSRLKNLERGEHVAIVYLGQATSEKRKKPYHNFEVYHSMPENPDENADRVDGDNIDFNDLDLDLDSIKNEVK